MATIRSAYAPVDFQRKPEAVWPDKVPPLTAAEAERAYRRLWRFGMGELPRRVVVITSGNRRACTFHVEAGKAHINPEQGWRALVHDLSHIMVERENPGEGHSKFHGRFESKLAREVLKRGWLDGTLRDKPKAPKADPTANDKRRARLERLQERVTAWERKRDRAERALAKLARQIRGTERHLKAAA